VGNQSVTLIASQNNCVGSYTGTIFVSPEPTAFFLPGIESPQLAGTVIPFNDLSQGNGGTIVSWYWTANDVFIGDTPNIDWDNTLPGIYTIELTIWTADGCSATYSMSYEIFAGDVDIPNVFTPNGDGLNDFFVIENGQYYQNTLNIFNRWGMPVYTTNNYRNNWRGTDLPDGTYYYVFTLSDGREFTGHVTLLR
jgi:gliding motility-associated-like protein